MTAPIAPLAPPAPPTVWLTSTELQNRLRIGHTCLGELKQAGVLQAGIHYVRKGSGPRGRLAWDVGAVEATLRQRALAVAASEAPPSSRREGATGKRQVI